MGTIKEETVVVKIHVGKMVKVPNRGLERKISRWKEFKMRNESEWLLQANT